MPQPTISQVHVNQPLSDLSIRYRNAKAVAEILLPEVKVVKDSNLIWTKGKQNFLIQNTQSAPGVAAKRSGFTVNTDLSYNCKLHKFADDLPKQIKDNQDDGLKLETNKVEFVTDTLALREEYDVMTSLTTTSTYATGNYNTLTGTDKFTDYVNSDPVALIQDCTNTVFSKIFQNVNTIVISRDVWLVLRNHPKIIERYKYVAGGNITKAMVAAALEIDNLVVAEMGYNTVAETTAETFTSAFLWSKVIVMAYVNPSPGLDTITFGQTFRQNGYRKTRQWEDQECESTVYEVQDNYDSKVMINTAGYLLKDVIG